MIRTLSVLMAGLAIGSAFAQTTGPVAPDGGATSAAVPAAPTPSALPGCTQVCAGSLVELEITQAISSKAQKNGDPVELRLAAPLLIDGIERVPAGTVGAGEVVHAAPSRGGGKPGELLLAARYLDLDGRRIPLRGMSLAARGKDNSGQAIGLAIALGPFAMLRHGDEIEIPAGTRAHAKLARDLESALAEGAAPPATTSPAPLDVSQPAAPDGAAHQPKE